MIPTTGPENLVFFSTFSRLGDSKVDPVLRARAPAFGRTNPGLNPGFQRPFSGVGAPGSIAWGIDRNEGLLEVHRPTAAGRDKNAVTPGRPMDHALGSHSVGGTRDFLQ